MRIGELARRTELSTSRIRFYEAHGLLPQAERTDNGYRDYPDRLVDVLRLIDDAQKLGFSLGEIRSGLAKAGENWPAKADLLEALRDKLDGLGRQAEEISLKRRRIRELIRELEDECPDEEPQ